MKSLAALLLFPLTVWGVEIPVGTYLEIRLTTPVSTVTSRAQDSLQAILIAPVTVNSRAVLAAGAALRGTILEVVAPAEETNAVLKLSFTQLAEGSHEYRMSTRVFGIDNVRETVDDTGAIQGISPKNTITGRIDQGLGKMNNGRMGGLAQVLEMAKGVLIKNADPNIAYDAGTELTLRLLKPLALPDSQIPPPTPGVTDDGRLADLVRNQPFQTYASNPPKPSDVTNLMFIGTLQQITSAFEEAGWVGSQALSGGSKFETAKAIIEQRGYKEAPVSTILLDNRPPDLVLQKANNTFAARHHLRIWQSPDTYRGQQVWLCGATHDIGIDYSDQDRTFIHKIDSNIDLERLKVTNDLLLTGKVRGVTLVARPNVPTNFRNATGDDVDTDARVAVIQF